MKEPGTGNGEQGADAGNDRPATNHAFQTWRFAGLALIVLCAGVAVVPEVMRGPSCGHDFDFHLMSWIDALHSWRQGILYPHWTPTPNFTAGEPRFVFYPPLTWMLGALLGIVIPWKFVPQVITFLLFLATGVATRALARQAFNEGAATLAGCAAIFSGYALFTAYERAAFAEMTGGFWVPLLLMLLLRDFRPGAPAMRAEQRVRKAFDGTSLLLALVVAGAWLSNAPLGVMVSYLLAGVALLLAILGRSWVPVARATAAAVLGLGLSAFFWIPAEWEQRWVAIPQAVDDPGLLIENSWLFARHHDPRLALHDIELMRVSFIAAAMVAVALGGVAVSWWRRTLPAQRAWWIPLAVIPVVIFFLQLPASDFIWNALPKMRFLQFPWRWLVVLQAPMAVLFAAAAWKGGRVWRGLITIGCCAAVAAGTLLAYGSLFQTCDEDDRVSGVLRDYRAGTGVAGTDEYAPPGADNALVADDLPFACLVGDPSITLGKGDPGMTPDWSAEQGTCAATYDESSQSPEHHRLHAEIPHPGYLVLRLRRYPAWRVTVNGGNAGPMPAREDGLMAIPVPRGTVQVTADWSTTPDVATGRLVSIGALSLITLLWLREFRRSRARLS